MKNLQAAQIDALKNRLQGTLVLAGDAAYDSARQAWNAMIDKHPAAIVRCAGKPEVVHEVNFARDQA